MYEIHHQYQLFVYIYERHHKYQLLHLAHIQTFQRCQHTYAVPKRNGEFAR